MQEKFYIGDLILKKGSMEVASIIFIGSEKLDNNRWKVNFAFTFTNGYAGHGTNMSLTVMLGEQYRFSKGFKGANKEQGLLGGEKKVFKEIEYIQFDDIEKDCITLSLY